MAYPKAASLQDRCTALDMLQAYFCRYCRCIFTLKIFLTGRFGSFFLSLLIFLPPFYCFFSRRTLRNFCGFLLVFFFRVLALSCLNCAPLVSHSSDGFGQSCASGYLPVETLITPHPMFPSMFEIFSNLLCRSHRLAVDSFSLSSVVSSVFKAFRVCSNPSGWESASVASSLKFNVSKSVCANVAIHFFLGNFLFSTSFLPFFIVMLFWLVRLTI